MKINSNFLKSQKGKVSDNREEYELSFYELMKIYNHGYNNQRLERMRDVFCFLCFSGLSVSEAEKLERKNIKKSSIQFMRNKNLENIPLNKIEKEILDRYKNELRPLPIIPNQDTHDFTHSIEVLLKIKEKIKRISFDRENINEDYLYIQQV